VTPKVRSALAGIRAVALDVDGVLTDDTFFWGPDGEEWKRFAFTDVMGVSRATKAGLTFALISGEASPLVDRYAAKMSIAHVFKGAKDKAAALKEYGARLELDMGAIAFVGNDVNDLGAMDLCGLAACPSDAHPSVLARVHYVATKPAGHGAVREVLDLIMERSAPPVVEETKSPSVASRGQATFWKSELDEHQRVLQKLVEESEDVLSRLADVFVTAFRRGNKLLFCGNGGSAADAQHIAAEFINRFRFDRDPLPAIALTTDSSVLTCIGNDSSFGEVFAKQVKALANEGDVVVGISTSGKSANVLQALEVARAKKAITIGFTGEAGRDRMAAYCDHVLAAPSRDTARIQEVHEFALHGIAALVEKTMFTPS
jgi:D-sedoheptulose 7-phosphate isomerase